MLLLPITSRGRERRECACQKCDNKFIFSVPHTYTHTYMHLSYNNKTAGHIFMGNLQVFFKHLKLVCGQNMMHEDVRYLSTKYKEPSG